jgi:V/A-type H+-transporting ATPase subunit G/H
MGDGALDRLLDAEKEAKSLVDKAKDQARLMLEKAEKDAQRSRNIGMKEFLVKRDEILESSKVQAQNEAEKIRRDGIDLAKGLSGRSKPRIPVAVEKVLQMLLEQEKP